MRERVRRAPKCSTASVLGTMHDAYVIRQFVARGLECMVAQSFSKNLGLYNERAGCLHAVCKTKDSAARVESQLKRIAQEIIIDQQQEIAAMKLAIGQPLPPSTPAPTQGGDHHSPMEH